MLVELFGNKSKIVEMKTVLFGLIALFYLCNVPQDMTKGETYVPLL